MRRFAATLKLLAAVVLAVSALHGVLGPGADAMLGAAVPAGIADEPSLDSQNRFFGVAFALYAAVLYLCATDPPRFEPVLKAALLIFFLAGVARIVSWLARGTPAVMVVVLAASELVLPPLLWLWYERVRGVA